VDLANNFKRCIVRSETLEKIDGSPGLPLNNLIGQGQAQAQASDNSPVKNSTVDLSGKLESHNETTDRLTIDGTTQVLRQAEATLNNEAPVDSQKVAQIRQAIADGSYQINAGRIADGILSMEQSLYQK